MQTKQCEAVLENKQENIEENDFGIASSSYSNDGEQVVSGDFQNQVIVWKINHSSF